MRSPLSNNRGIALITSLMLTLISLTIVMYLLYMITAGVKQSGASKRYKSALDASYGSTEIVMKEVFPVLFANIATPATALSSAGFASSLNLTSSSDACLVEKLTRPASRWSAACNTASFDVKSSPDITLKLNSTSSDSFTVYTKIVETICSDPRPYPAGNCTGSDLSGMELLDGGAGVAGGSTGVSVQHFPASYRIEVQGERSTNPLEKSKLSVLYAY